MCALGKSRRWTRKKQRKLSKRSCIVTRSFTNSSLTSRGNLPLTNFSISFTMAQVALIPASATQATRAPNLKPRESRRWTKTHQLWTAKTKGRAEASLKMTTINQMWPVVTKTTATSRINTRKLKMCLNCLSMKPSISSTTRRFSDAVARASRSNSKLRSTLSARVWASMNFNTSNFL